MRARTSSSPRHLTPENEGPSRPFVFSFGVLPAKVNDMTTHTRKIKRKKGRYLSQQDWQTLWEKDFEPVVRERTDEILEVWYGGEAIPIVLVGPSQLARAAAQRLGWDGSSTVFGASRGLLERALERAPGVRAWLDQPPTEGGPIHVWLWQGSGNLMMVWTQEGWDIAPGTLDLNILN